MPYTAPATHRRPVLKCVRCGIEPRYADTWIGLECVVNGTYRVESAEAEALPLDFRGRRRWLVEERGWYGSW
jgi:hypothetical protein